LECNFPWLSKRIDQSSPNNNVNYSTNCFFRWSVVLARHHFSGNDATSTDLSTCATQSSHALHSDSGNGLLCLVITYLMLAWPATALSYDADSYDTIQKLQAIPVAGITQTDIRQFKWAIVNEMWLRQIIPGDQTCISGNALICQLADVVSEDNSR
jgi:hypothetical protein